MNAERWQAIGELFEQAWPLPVGERTALLDSACGVDQELRREVVSLLASHNAGGLAGVLKTRSVERDSRANSRKPGGGDHLD